MCTYYQLALRGASQGLKLDTVDTRLARLWQR